MLKLAIEAGLPLITVYTDDPVNAGAVIAAIAGVKTEPYSPALKTMIQKGGLYYCSHSDSLDYKNLYKQMSVRKAILCVINPPVTDSATFDAGIITPPASMIRAFVRKYCGGEHEDGLVAALSGLSFKEAIEVTRLAMAKHGEYSARAVGDIRRTFFGYVRGLQQVSTAFLYYAPNPALQNWLASSGRFLTEFDVPLLRPRGLLFNGPPGTGKTMGAKYLASELDIPLYHLDVGVLMSKFVGESEQNLNTALKQAEQCAPCIMLIDEVEKLFHNNTDDSGVTSRLLSSVLWWLQEHTSQVLTIMTTNKQSDIPPELYRSGRIDCELMFNLLEGEDTNKFAQELADKMSFILPLKMSELSVFTGAFSHADITEAVLSEMKRAYLSEQGCDTIPD